MANYCCPLCSAPMHTTFKPSDHPAIPDRLLLHCTNKQCDLSISTDDLEAFDPSLYGTPAITDMGLEAW